MSKWHPRPQRGPQRRTSGGLTLVELMIAMALSLTVAAGLFSLYVAQQRVNQTQTALDAQTETIGSLSSFVTREIRRAGFGIAAPENGVVVSTDIGVRITYLRPGAVDETELDIYLDRDTSTVVASRDDGTTEFPVHPVGGVIDLELRCLDAGAVASTPCVVGASPTAMEWIVTFSGAPNGDVRERTLRIFAASRNALLAANAP